MKLLSFILLLFLFSNTSFGQDLKLEKALRKFKKIENTEEAQQYIEDFPSYKGYVSAVYPEIDTTSSYSEILPSLDKGEYYNFTSSYDSSEVYLKPLEWKHDKLYRVRYIFLDNTKLTKPEIDSLRQVIVNKLYNEEDFQALAKVYSMDANAKNGGDLGWFQEGMMIKSFEEAVKSHSKGEIYFVDIPEKKWYYVVLNSFDPITSKGLKYISIRIKR